MDRRNQIYLECFLVRRAIELKKDELGITWFSDFPAGCCSDTSLILAEYLKRKGFGIATHVSGELDGHSHAWLELKGLIIDITADQFDEIDSAVIVEQESIYHQKYENEEIRRVPYNHLLTGQNFFDYELFKACDIICSAIGNRDNH